MNQPGVKLVAVEFLADWCKPCNEAIPKWRELHEKYRDRGFRLVMVGVNTAGKCSSPGWSPDKIVCDYTGEIAEAWAAKDLPQAFLWSWQGSLLVEHGDVEEVAAQVDKWFAEAPRILVGEPTTEDGKKVREAAQIRRLVRNELSRQAKFDIVASEDEAKEIARLKERSHSLTFDESQRCRLGKEVSPNSKLSVTVLSGGKRKRLLLEMFSLERSCLVASAVAPIPSSADGMDKAVIEAVAGLNTDLGGKVRQPSRLGRTTVTEGETSRGAVGTPVGGKETIIRGERKGVDLGDSEHILSVLTVPSGAMVSVDGAPPRSENTRFLLPAGAHEVEVFKEWYSPHKQSVRLDDNRELHVKLEPNWGTLSVASSPSGAAIRVNGQEMGATPMQRKLAPGGYRVELTLPMYLTYEKQFNIEKGEIESISHAMGANFGTLEVETNPAGASIVLNGLKVGATPAAAIRLPAGQVNLTLLHPGYHPVKYEGLNIQRGESRRISENLVPKTGGLKVIALDAAGAPVPAVVYFDRIRIGEAPLATEVIIGSHRVEAEYEGQRDAEEVTVVEGEVTRVQLSIDRKVAAHPKPAVTDRQPILPLAAPREESRTSKTRWRRVGSGIAGAGVGGGVLR